ncbi:hypothetical protein PALI_b0154 [Pseudoalteromonas aliena SW19]|uniref:Uncharacterized protein n=2 Tax=Pseudoalteromonas aliena TaxID=247523 RepID=A0ABR9E3Q3_9GAMM|nr:hypothetical protein [Pseudoalteromonas aliena SW19]
MEMTKESLIKEIKSLKSDFEESRKKAKPNHLIARRLGSFSLFLFIASTLIAINLKLTGINLNLKFEPFNYLCLLLMPLILVLYYYFFIHLMKNEGEKKLLFGLRLFNFFIFVFYVFALIVFKTADIILLLSGGFLLSYFICYLSNKQYGYTRSWSRSEKYYFLLQSLEWEVNQVDEEKKYLKDIKLDELTSKFTKIIELQLNERQRDIIGDYLSANELLLNWTKK